MTYLQYHLVFIVPVLLALISLTWRRRGPLAGAYCTEDRWARLWFWVLAGLALVYTTPWDNYLVFREVWTYPPERVLGRIGYVPIEEYSFFLLQTAISGLFLLALMRRGGAAKVAGNPAVARWGGAAFLLALSFVGAWCLQQERTLYLGLILAWAMPVLAGQWAFGGDLILGRARLFWTAVLIPTVYLWLTDAFAIGNGIWSINDRFTVGLKLGVLPLEEMLFFLVTNLLVVTGLMLFLHPVARERLARAVPFLRPWLGFLALSVLLNIPVPLWPAGFPVLATLSTAALFLAGLAFAWERVGAVRALGLAALGFGVGWAAELLGSRLGLPFGQYSYLGSPGPLLAGVPLLVPLGWFAMTLAVTQLAGGRAWLAGLLLVAWDVGLEPLMTAQGYWTWRDPAPLWAGAPIQNFLSWWALGTALAWAFGRLAPGLFSAGSGSWSVSVVYYSQLFLLPGGLLLLGQPLAAGVTLLAMSVALLLTRVQGRQVEVGAA